MPILHDMLDGPENILISVACETFSDVELLPCLLPLSEGLQELVTANSGYEEIFDAAAHCSKMVL